MYVPFGLGVGFFVVVGAIVVVVVVGTMVVVVVSSRNSKIYVGFYFNKKTYLTTLPTTERTSVNKQYTLR